jgi:hypothetical protein
MLADPQLATAQAHKPIRKISVLAVRGGQKAILSRVKMASLIAMFYEKLINRSPIRVNPIISIIFAFTLAYVPHFLKRPLVMRKLKEKGLKFELADSRLLGSSCVDITPLGRAVAVHIGCHQNGLEALIYYIPSILIGIIMQIEPDTLEHAAGVFLTFRVIYTVAYLSSLNGVLRSLSFTGGLLTALGLYWSAYERYIAFGYTK